MPRMTLVRAWDKLWEYLPPVESHPEMGEAVDRIQQSGRWTVAQIESLYELVEQLRRPR